MKFLKVGDVICHSGFGTEPIFRKIIECRHSGYTWIYPEVPEKYFYSEDSNDEFFEEGWEIFEPERQVSENHFAVKIALKMKKCKS